VFEVDGVPCNKPPWGYLVAVDLNRGDIVWKVPAGTSEHGEQGLFGYGPALVTAGGLVFHAGTSDLHLRAHDAATGAVLARFDLPAGLHAGPITYKLRRNGKQYLVVAPGGHVGIGSKLGDHIVAYTLP
jgi:quinoprotein glucose dehydrogenase